LVGKGGLVGFPHVGLNLLVVVVHLLLVETRHRLVVTRDVIMQHLDRSFVVGSLTDPVKDLLDLLLCLLLIPLLVGEFLDLSQ
jgi:hypothetical protein